MNQKGIVLSGLIYVLLTFFILLLITLLAVLWYKQNAADALRKDADAIYDDIYISEFSKEFAYTGDYQTFVVPMNGNYKIELWGASGGNTKYDIGGTGNDVIGGLGAYTSGTLFLKTNETFYIYVGGKGQNGGVLTGVQALGGYNGGGNGLIGTITEQNSGGGGGATDIRLVSGTWNDTISLRSRIMVSAGGGGASNWHNASSGGYGGSLVGGAGKLNLGAIAHTLATGGTQASGGSPGGTDGLGSPGAFGVGGASNTSHGSGGGAGYYGGGGSGYIVSGVSSGAGGSSFVSGYPGCNAINEAGTHTGQPNHYSGYIFNNTQMIDGNASMPSTTGGIEVGHTGNGYAKITYLP